MIKHSPCVGIRTCSDYSPFGVELDGRTVSNYGYRFGYQGSEKDNEFKGDGNSYTTEFRQLDPRLGRWLSLDKLISKYPEFSPFSTFNNNPIYFTDASGLEGEPKEGETRIENKLQQVYTGSGEGQGWKNANDVKYFQGSDDNGVFIRIGEEGAYVFQKIENVIITIGKTAEFGLGETSYSNQIGIGNSWLILTSDIEDANKIFKETFGDFTLGTMVIDTHGGSKLDRNDIGNLAYFTTSINVGFEDRLERYAIDDANAGFLSVGVSQIEYNDAIAFNSLTNSISPNGSLILTGCYVGKDNNLFRSIDKATKNEINIYANRDITLANIYTINVNFTTENKSYFSGWVQFNTENNKTMNLGKLNFNF
ncbi:RHS repeat-associated core domain-containing protein [Flavobacterium sp.]|uniref:RHS repeat-associated core domain-containing protein n=1 Tax=Flavobacterium sp. TaxID=239 RepID=UPI0025DF59F9|nr:RHS repeat-associated core domain-containing protein [Flavobacterium sp.]